MGYTDTKRIYHKLNPSRMEQFRRAHEGARKAGYVEEMLAKWLEGRTLMTDVKNRAHEGARKAGYVEEMLAKWLEGHTLMPVVLPPKSDALLTEWIAVEGLYYSNTTRH
eukprot:GHVH01012822.1.p2 GENE.GHVH01012822.1~~GHVH01012822.1.p2  ORF type:complete len:109 (-),score=12.76 GHVH01012822.1:726-1052(-)